MEIAPETPRDRAAVRGVHALAFERPNEADLVDTLRDAVWPTISLVACEGPQVVGHVFFSPVVVAADTVVAGRITRGTAREGVQPWPQAAIPQPWPAVALGPLAVAPSRQRCGIGSALVHAGREECRRRGEMVVFVLGHPAFYPRFGFVPAAPLGLRSEFPVPDAVFMVAELAPGSLRRRRGLVRYHPCFHDL